MERAIAEMEKIRRAEEIYARRKNSDEDEKKNSSRSIYKILFEILLLINIVIILVAIQNQKYIFTEDFIKQVNSYNVNIKSKIEQIFTTPSTAPKINVENEKKEENIASESMVVSGESNDVSSALVENDAEEVQVELSQEEQDVLAIKNNYSIILPISGIKTSGYGERNSSNSKVTKFHTGVDIAAPLGTVIKSASSGKVIQVSSIGDYGKHIRVQIGDLVVLYAHCSKIYVTEGQEVEQGEEIAEVGSTGNSTGPHLHFELRLNNRLVDPEKIISI